MFLNSSLFPVFFLSVYGLYLVLGRQWQNRLLLVASYVFYGLCDWRFIPLLFVASWISFYSGIKITASKDRRWKLRYLQAALVLELGLLIFFKYANHITSLPFQVLLPLGISYYTFQAIAYSVDVYRGHVVATRDFVDFFVFKSFFPIISSGPIERAKNLLVQLQKDRRVNAACLGQGLFLVSWGFFKKQYIANHLSPVVDGLFERSASINGLETWLAALAFTFQIYCDFSGYTDIARGLAKLMGFDLALNFNLPFFARNPVEFWRRWHMSLSTWFYDYFYEPLFYWVKNIYVALFCTFFLIGIWHGASWNFAILGGFNGVVMCSYVFLRPYLRKFLEGRSARFQGVFDWVSVVVMFHVTCFGLLLFRSTSIAQIQSLCLHLLSGRYFPTQKFVSGLGAVLFFVAPLLAMQILQVKTGDLLAFLKIGPRWRFAASVVAVQLLLLVYLFTGGIQGLGQFIYFDF